MNMMQRLNIVTMKTVEAKKLRQVLDVRIDISILYTIEYSGLTINNTQESRHAMSATSSTPTLEGESEARAVFVSQVSETSHFIISAVE